MHSERAKRASEAGMSRRLENLRKLDAQVANWFIERDKLAEKRRKLVASLQDDPEYHAYQKELMDYLSNGIEGEKP
jgi:phosphoserine phosphatase